LTGAGIDWLREADGGDAACTFGGGDRFSTFLEGYLCSIDRVSVKFVILILKKANEKKKKKKKKK
jgi:hypothetical protein